MIKIYFFVKKKGKRCENWSLHSSEHRARLTSHDSLTRGFVRRPKPHEVASTQIWHHFTSGPHSATAGAWVLIGGLGWLHCRNRSDQGDGQNEHTRRGVSKVHIPSCSGPWGNQLIGFSHLILLIWGIFPMNVNVIKIIFRQFFTLISNTVTGFLFLF